MLMALPAMVTATSLAGLLELSCVRANFLGPCAKAAARSNKVVSASFMGADVPPCKYITGMRGSRPRGKAKKEFTAETPRRRGSTEGGREKEIPVMWRPWIRFRGSSAEGAEKSAAE